MNIVPRELSLAAKSLLLELVDPGATGIVVHTSAGWRPVGSKAGAPPHNGFMTNTTWTQATINALVARDYLRVESGSSMSLSGAGRDRALERRAAS